MNSRKLLYLIMFLSGVVVGKVVGNLVAGISALSWLAKGVTFGLDNPVRLNLGVMTLDFGFSINLTVSCVIFILIALYIARKVS